MFQKFIKQPKTLLEAKVNLERAINDLRKYYSDEFNATLLKDGVGALSTELYRSMHAMEAMHNIKLTLK